MLTLAGLCIIIAAIAAAFFSARDKAQAGTGNRGMMLDVKEWCDFDIVGEASYQDAIGKLARTGDRHVAHLRPEPENPFDKNAVAVFIGHDKVGYLSKRDAQTFVNELALAGIRGVMFACPAYITGGFKKEDGAHAHFGIKLGIREPIRILPMT